MTYRTVRMDELSGSTEELMNNRIASTPTAPLCFLVSDGFTSRAAPSPGMEWDNGGFFTWKVLENRSHSTETRSFFQMG